MNNSYFEEPMALALEMKREKARQRGNITFDCYNAIYPPYGVRAHCQLGYKMGASGDGNMEVVSILAGRSGIGCRECEDFRGG